MKNIVVIKFGGNALNHDSASALATSIAKLVKQGFYPVVVHGGGPQIDEMLSKQQIAPRFIDGMRYTDEQTLAIVEMVLCGQMNKLLVSHLNAAGCLGVGLSGKDGLLLQADKLTSPDLGEVGEIKHVEVGLLKTLLSARFVPVIAPIASGEQPLKTYNINADLAAAAIAKALHAKDFILMSNISGLLDANGNVLHKTTPKQIEALIASGVIHGGMIPKVQAAVAALDYVLRVHLLDGREQGVLERALMQENVGTMIGHEER